MPTPDSSLTSYASAADLLKRFDARQIGDAIGDAGARVSAADILTDDNVAAAMLDASGDVESACLVAGRYQAADLAALTGAAQSHLKRIVCVLAMRYLTERRTPDAQLGEPVKWAREQLTLLRNGERIFGLDEQQDAATIQRIDDTNVNTFPGLTEYAQRVFGIRSKYIPRT